MLFDDAFGEHVGHVQDLFVYFVERGNVGGPIALNPGGDFRSR